MSQRIQALNQKYYEEWLPNKKENLVSPGWFFEDLNQRLNPEAYVVVDDGKHTFLAAELLITQMPRHFISPTDLVCLNLFVDIFVLFYLERL